MLYFNALQLRNTTDIHVATLLFIGCEDVFFSVCSSPTSAAWMPQDSPNTLRTEMSDYGVGGNEKRPAAPPKRLNKESKG